MKRLAIITTHPVQYNAPWFKLLTERKKVYPKVFYTWGQLQNEKKYDPGFGKNVEWDIPLLQEYEYTFVDNVSKQAGSHHSKGINNPSLINEIEKWRPDAILVFGWNFKSHLQVMHYFKRKVKVLFRGDSNFLDDNRMFSLKRLVRKVYLQQVFKKIDSALYVGSANKYYYQQCGVPDIKLQFAPHAVDNERFNVSVNDLRQQLSIPAKATVILYAGKLEQKKSPLLLLEAFIEANIKNAHLIIAGNGILEASLKTRANLLDKPIKDRIHFLGFQNQTMMPSLYQSCDLFVLPSGGPGETWGLAVNEAMAAGKAVLVSDKCGCAQDLVVNGVNGYVCKSNNLADLNEKLIWLCANKNELVSMGKKSLEMIQPWSFTSICNTIEKVMVSNNNSA